MDIAAAQRSSLGPADLTCTTDKTGVVLHHGVVARTKLETGVDKTVQKTNLGVLCCQDPEVLTQKAEGTETFILLARQTIERTFRTSPVARCLGQTAGGGRPGAAAHPRSRTVNAVAAVSSKDPAPPRSVPTRSARRTVGPPITTGYTPMRAEDLTAREKIARAWDLATIRSTARAPLLSRSGDWAMTAITDQTRDELE